MGRARDVAEVAVGRLLNPYPSGRIIQAVHGPADLSWGRPQPWSPTSAAVRWVSSRSPTTDMRSDLASTGMGPELVEAVMGMSTGLRDGFTPEQPRDATTTTPTTLGVWAYDVLQPPLDG